MLPQALKLKVIRQASEGKLQKDIAQDLGISTGSVSTILKKDMQKYEGNSDSIPQEQPKQPSVVAKDTVLKPEYSDLQIISQPQSQEIQNIQQQQPLVSSQEPHLESKDEPSGGCQLSRFILQEDIQPQIPGVTFNPKEDRFSPKYNPVNQSTTITSPGKTSQPSADIEDIDFDEYSDPDYDPDIYTDPDAEYDPTYDGDPSNSLEEGWDSEPERSERRIQTTARPTRHLESFRTQKQEEWPRYKPRTALSNHQDSLGWDPDDQTSVNRRFFKTILDEKKRRQEEEHSLEEQRAYLIQERHNIEEQKKTLEAREKKLLSVEDLIPSAKKLKDIGIGFVEALVWIDCIKDVAQKEQVDERTAAWKLADILRSFKELSDLEKAIARANQQFALLNTANDQQRNAISTLVNLKNAGFTEKDIMELTAVVNTWNARSGRSGIASLSYNNGGKKLDTELIGVEH